MNTRSSSRSYTQMHEALLARLYETVYTNVDTVQQAEYGSLPGRHDITPSRITVGAA